MFENNQKVSSRIDGFAPIVVSINSVTSLGMWLLLVTALTLALNVGCDSSMTGASVTGTNSTDRPSPTASETSVNPTADLEEPLKLGAVSEQDSTPSAPSQSIPTVDSTFDDLKFDMEKTDHFDRSRLTPQIEKLFGKKIRIRGYIYPTLRKRGLKQFVLVRDNLECCFGPGAALYDCILIRMQPDKTAEYTIRPVAVEGVFRFEEFLGPDGKHLAIFCLDGEKVE